MRRDVEILKRPLRSIRSWPPLNHLLTAGGRAALQTGGWSAGPLPRLLPRAGLVESPLPDGKVLRMWSRADDDVTPQVYWNGWAGHEPETSTLFYERARSARTTIDIGAHVGYFALLAGHANSAGDVYAFEPHPLVYERLTRNTALNDLGNVSCQQLAVGNKGGVARFYYARGGINSSSSLSQRFMESIVVNSRLESSEVHVVSLDDFVDERHIADVDLVKIDTETTEGDVFEGMVRTLRRDEPIVFCEVLQSSAGGVIERILDDFAYRYFLLTDKGPMRRAHVLPEPPWRNFYLVPESRCGNGEFDQ